MVKRQPLHAERLRSVGFEPEGGVLEVELRDGRIYRYLRVPRRLYLGLRNAASPDAFFDEQIKLDFTFYQLPEHAYAV